MLIIQIFDETLKINIDTLALSTQRKDRLRRQLIANSQLSLITQTISQNALKIRIGCNFQWNHQKGNFQRCKPSYRILHSWRRRRMENIRRIKIRNEPNGIQWSQWNSMELSIFFYFWCKMDNRLAEALSNVLYIGFLFSSDCSVVCNIEFAC